MVFCFVFKAKKQNDKNPKWNQPPTPNQHESDWLNLNSLISKTAALLAEWTGDFLNDQCLYLALP